MISPLAGNRPVTASLISALVSGTSIPLLCNQGTTFERTVSKYDDKRS